MNSLKHILQLMFEAVRKIAQMNADKIVAGVGYCLVNPLLTEDFSLSDGVDDMQGQIENQILENFLKPIGVEVEGGGLVNDGRVEEYRLKLFLLRLALALNFGTFGGFQLGRDRL
jgi:hypothetical protein